MNEENAQQINIMCKSLIIKALTGNKKKRESVCVWVRESVRERENKKKKGSA